MDVFKKLERITEGRRPHRSDLDLARPGRGHGSGPSTRHQKLGGKKSGRGVIWKRTVISPGSRSSGKGMKAGQVSYTRLTDKPRSVTHPGQKHGPLADFPATTPAPIEGRLRDVVAMAKRGGKRAASAVKKFARRIRGQS